MGKSRAKIGDASDFCVERGGVVTHPSPHSSPNFKAIHLNSGAEERQVEIYFWSGESGLKRLAQYQFMGGAS